MSTRIKHHYRIANETDFSVSILYKLTTLSRYKYFCFGVANSHSYSGRVISFSFGNSQRASARINAFGCIIISRFAFMASCGGGGGGGAGLFSFLSPCCAAVCREVPNCGSRLLARIYCNATARKLLFASLPTITSSLPVLLCCAG